MLHLENVTVTDGYSPSVRQPGLYVVVGLSQNPSSEEIRAIAERVKQAISAGFKLVVEWDPTEVENLAYTAMTLFQAILKSQGNLHSSQLQMSELAGRSDNPSRLFACHVPVSSYLLKLGVYRKAMNMLLSMFNNCIEGDVDSGVLEEDASELERVVTDAVLSTYTRREVVKAAQSLNIPWIEIAPGVHRIGWGKNSRLFEGTDSDSTPIISSRLVQNKRKTATYLRSMGFPVVEGGTVNTLEQARDIAMQLGYPVVLKPVAAEGGESVFTGLQSEQDLIWAFSQMKESLKPFTVERHFEGLDYRVHISRGNIYTIVQRKPAYVIGDGSSTIEQLIAETNADRQYRFGRDKELLDEYEEGAFLPIEIDEETHRWLSHQNLSLESIPDQNCEVRLKGAANVGKGGTKRKVRFSEVHPINAAMLISCAQAVRLDTAGIDFLIPDIGTPWTQSGACICEVNSMPQLFDGHEILLQLNVENKGRIPVTLVSCKESSEMLVKSVYQIAKDANFHPAVVSANFAVVGGEIFDGERFNMPAIERRALSDTRVDHFIYVVQEQDSKRLFPVDRADIVLQMDQAADNVAAGSSTLSIPKHILWMCTPQTKVIGSNDPNQDAATTQKSLLGAYKNLLASS